MNVFFIQLLPWDCVPDSFKTKYQYQEYIILKKYRHMVKNLNKNKRLQYK
jgi:hypothetical protein